MDLGWLPQIICLIAGMGIGTIYGSWVNDEWQKEKEDKDERSY